MNIDKAIKKFQEIRDISYRIPLTTKETDCCCSGKHILLKKILKDLGYQSRYRVCSFDWSDLKLPEALCRIPHDIDSTHVFLEVKIADKWVSLDATWDKKLAAIFPINDWDGKSDTPIAVPVIKKFTVETSNELMLSENKSSIQKDIAKNSKFYEAFNNWLEAIRSNKKF